MCITRKFLWWPRKFPSSSCTRWLEYADVVAVVEKESYAAYLSPAQHKWRWVEFGFADELNTDVIKQHYGACGEDAFVDAYRKFCA